MAITAPTFHPTSGTLIIDGSNFADQVVVSEPVAGTISVVQTTNGEKLVSSFAKDAVPAILFVGNDGNDTFSNNTDIISTAYGSAGDDILTGGSAGDILHGGDGNDQLYGGTGDDDLSGDAGNDVLRGDAGNDRMWGGLGNDILHGEAGNDLLHGDAGSDYLYGGSGEDILRGHEGNDVLYGGLGDDELYGNEDNDTIYGEAGTDALVGDSGDDVLNGGDGNDDISGGDGNDRLEGGAGNDYLVAGDGADLVFGESGNDVLLGNAGDDRLYGGDDNDRLYGGEGNDQLYGQAGDDELLGEDGGDWLLGGDGNDNLIGGLGNDNLHGETGNDVLHGDAGSDYLFGGSGTDILRGHEGNDLLSGGDGDDELFGHAGNDVLIGGNGSDLLTGEEGEDLLIGASLNFSLAEFTTLRTTWNNGTDFQSRLQKIEDEAFTEYLRIGETIQEDYVSDQIFGGDGSDWFFQTGQLSVYDAAHTMIVHHALDTAMVGHTHPATSITHVPPVLEGFDLIDSLDVIAAVSQDGDVVRTLIPHADNPSKRNEHLALFQLVRYDQVTHTALSNGNWSDPATWQDGIVPSSGARVLIPLNIEVTVDRKMVNEIATVRVDGTLRFATNVNTELRVDTMVVSTTGRLEIGTATAPISGNVSARLIFTDNAPIDRTWDPYGISRGLITHGSVEMRGAAVTSYANLSGAVRAGNSTLTLSAVPLGWSVGDQIVIAGTVAGQHQDEVRTILGINGNRVVMEPLTYDHLMPATGLSVQVANLTRNIVLESEGTAVERLGHVMFMHNPDVQIDYAAFNKLGRTNKLQAVNDPVLDADWNLVPGTGTNPRARYAVHFHRAGTSSAGESAKVRGSVVLNNPGWGYVNHSSNVDFTNNVSYNVTGAAFVTEVGDEIGSFVGNIALGTYGSGEEPNAREDIQDFGHGGDGFWFQGAGTTVVDNIAANADEAAFFYYTRGFGFNGHKATFSATNLTDPSIANGEDQILVDFVPVREFRDNIGYASRIGLHVRYHLRDATHNAQSVFQDSSFWNNTIGITLPYTHQTILRNLKVIQEPNSAYSVGIHSNAITKDIVYENLTALGYRIGILVAQRGYSIVDGGHFNAVQAIRVLSPTAEDRTVLVKGNIEFGASPLQQVESLVQNEVDMRLDETPLHGSIDHLFYNSSVVLDYNEFDNQSLYFYEQAATAIPFPSLTENIPEQFVGLTSLQLKLLYGLSIAGELAPLTATTTANIHGLIGSGILQDSLQRGLFRPGGQVGTGLLQATLQRGGFRFDS